MITTDALNALPTAAPPAAPETPAAPAAAPVAPPVAPEKTGERAAAASKTSRKQAAAARMAEATRQLNAMIAEPPAAPATPAPEAAPTAPRDEPVEPDKIVWDQGANRYRDPQTGNFVAAPEGAEPSAPATDTAAADAPPAAEAEAEAPAEETWHEVTLPSLQEGAEPVTLETDDPEMVEVLNQYKNGVMRRQEFQRRMEGIESRESQFREFEAMLQAAPEQLVETLSPENRARFTNYLLAQEFDRLRPTLEAWYQNDLARQQALLESQRHALDSRRTYEQMVQAQRWEASVLRAVSHLVPDSASAEDAADFTAVATTRLAQLAQQGADVRPETVAFHLERDLRRFGFLPSDVPAPDKTPSLMPTAPGAVAPKAAPPQAVADTAQATQRRLAAVAKDRQAAASIVPPGTAAAPAVQPPPIRSFKDAEKALAQVDPTAWQKSWQSGR